MTHDSTKGFTDYEPHTYRPDRSTSSTGYPCRVCGFAEVAHRKARRTAVETTQAGRLTIREYDDGSWDVILTGYEPGEALTVTSMWGNGGQAHGPGDGPRVTIRARS